MTYYGPANLTDEDRKQLSMLLQTLYIGVARTEPGHGTIAALTREDGALLLKAFRAQVLFYDPEPVQIVIVMEAPHAQG